MIFHTLSLKDFFKNLLTYLLAVYLFNTDHVRTKDFII